jgi:hypothetical protein
LSEKNFEIGQVVYILSEQAQTILPGVVVEECVVKKLSGNSVSWKVKVGAGDKAKLFDSAKIKGEVYGSLDEVRVVMTERLNKFVEDLTQAAEDRVEKWYGKEIAERERNNHSFVSQSNDPDDKIDPDVLLSSIENTAPAPKFTPEASRAPVPKSSMRDHLRNLATPPDEDLPVEGEGTVFMIDAGGNRVPVRMPKV